MKRFIFCALIPLTLLSGCSSVGDHIPGWLKPYTPDVHQGNVVTSEMVDALHKYSFNCKIACAFVAFFGKISNHQSWL